jgi:hypothetical protein
LHLSAEVADGWKQRMRTKQQTIISAAAGKTVSDAMSILLPRGVVPFACGLSNSQAAR